MIVVDAQTWVDNVTGALAQHHRHVLDNDDVASPAHVDFEVGSALRRMERHQRLGGDVTARDLFAVHARAPFDRSHERSDLVVAFDVMDNARYGDAIYLAMAKRLDCPLMTGDGGMVEAARINAIDVIDTRSEA